MPGYLVGDERKFSSPSYNYGGQLWSSEYYEESKLIKPTGKPYEIYVAPVDIITANDDYAHADAIFNTVQYEYNEALEQIWLYIGYEPYPCVYGSYKRK